MLEIIHIQTQSMGKIKSQLILQLDQHTLTSELLRFKNKILY